MYFILLLLAAALTIISIAFKELMSDPDGDVFISENNIR
jgi:hypothetical protein